MDCFSECDLIGNYLLFWLPSTSTEISRGKMNYLVVFQITKVVIFSLNLTNTSYIPVHLSHDIFIALDQTINDECN